MLQTLKLQNDKENDSRGKVYSTGQWFSQDTPGSSINKTDDITEMLLKVALNTMLCHFACYWVFTIKPVLVTTSIKQ